MADNLTDVGEARTLNWLTGNSTTAPVLPLVARLMTANGSDSAPGTEVANAGGSSYAPQSAPFGAATAGNPALNSADIVFANMPACTVAGVEIWDSAGTPVRWWWGAINTPTPVNLGQTARFLSGQLALTMQ